MLEAQKREQWVPRVGSNVYVPRMKGNFKVSCCLAAADPLCSKPRSKVQTGLRCKFARSMPDMCYIQEPVT